MKKWILSVFLLVWCGGESVAQYTQRQFDVKLWPSGLPNTNGKDNRPEDMSKAIYTPEIRVFLPDSLKATGRAVVACPGGGYSFVAMDHEGYAWAPYFNEKGIAYVVLKYRMPFGHKEVPQSDAQEAIRLVRAHAKEWHVNPNDVGIMGSSAGGHLASTVATLAPLPVRPDFQILFYPVISMDLHRTHQGSVYSLLGENPSEADKQAYSNERNVRRHRTPPAILLLSSDDTVVPSSNAVNYYTSLRNHHVPAALHIYPTGNHGWGFNSSFAHHEQMLTDLSAWLKGLKAPAAHAVRVACIGNSITDGAGIDMSDDYGYPAVLGRLLGEKYWVKNFGVSAHTMLNKGDHPYMRHPAYLDCKDFNPDIVVIKLGTNDSKSHNWKHKDEYMKDMQQMLDELKALPSEPEIYLAYPAKALKPSFDISDSVIVNDIKPMIRKMAKKNKLEIIDLYAPFEGRNDLMQRDGIHPNAEGAKVMAETVKAALLK